MNQRDEYKNDDGQGTRRVDEVIPWHARMTETQRINTVREHLQEKAQSGLLGVIAARSRVPEYQLHDWCKDPSKVPTYGELVDIQDALGLQVIYDTER